MNYINILYRSPPFAAFANFILARQGNVTWNASKKSYSHFAFPTNFQRKSYPVFKKQFYISPGATTIKTKYLLCSDQIQIEKMSSPKKKLTCCHDILSDSECEILEIPQSSNSKRTHHLKKRKKKLKSDKQIRKIESDNDFCEVIELSNQSKTDNKKRKLRNGTNNLSISPKKTQTNKSQEINVLKKSSLKLKTASKSVKERRPVSELEEGEIMSSDSEEFPYFSINQPKLQQPSPSRSSSSSSIVELDDDWIDSQLEMPINKSPKPLSCKNIKAIKQSTKALIEKHQQHKIKERLENTRFNVTKDMPIVNINSREEMANNDELIEENRFDITNEILSIINQKSDKKSKKKQMPEGTRLNISKENSPMVNQKSSIENNDFTLRRKTIDISSDVEEMDLLDYHDKISIDHDSDDNILPSNSRQNSDNEIEDPNKFYEYLNNEGNDSDSSVSSCHSINDSFQPDSEFIPIRGVDAASLDNPPVKITEKSRKMRNRIENMRKWNPTAFGHNYFSKSSHGNEQSNDIQFTLMSYNVLSQSLLRNNMYLYKNCEENNLEWEYRWALLQHEIKMLEPDILTLQEVEATHYHTHYEPWFSSYGFKGLFKKRTGGKVDGCAIFYNVSKFQLLEHTTVEYLQTNAPKILDRDNIALIAKFVPASGDGQPLCVATTHLLFNPKRFDIKLAQSVLLFTELDRFCYEGSRHGLPQYCPLIVTGDLNAQPSTALIEFWKNGALTFQGRDNKKLSRCASAGQRGYILGSELIPSTLGITEYCQHKNLAQSRALENVRGQIFSLIDKRNIEQDLIQISNTDWPDKLQHTSNYNNTGTGHLKHNLNLQSVYSHFLRKYNHSREATSNQDGWCTVDYIFYSTILNQHRKKIDGPLKLLAKYSLLCGNEPDIFGPLPSSACPSDHFPLAAQFLFKQ